MSQLNEQPPKWINPFLLLAAAALLGAALLALAGGWTEFDHRAGAIADLTVNLNGQPVREHCITCHTEGGRPLSKSALGGSAPHPDIAPHRIDLLGCTGCHLGEGMALDLQISHGLPGLGARKVLAGEDLQARCYVCHPLQPLMGAEEAWKGYRLYREKGCDLCHRVAGAQSGGRFGPDLSDVGSQLGLEKLVEAVKEPDLSPPNSIMPRFPLSGAQRQNLSYFLKSRVDNPYFATPMQVQAGLIELPEISAVPEDAAGLKPGEKLLHRGRCLACHKYAAQDGRIAPDLTWIGRMRERGYLADFLSAPARLIPGAIMPDSFLSPDEEKILVHFLEEEAVGDPPHATPKHLYMQLCQRCHAAKGDGHGLIAPNLANFPRAFADNAEYFRAMTQKRLVRSVDKGIPGTSMPPYGELLEPAEREILLDLIFGAFVGLERPLQAELPAVPPEPDRRPAAEHVEQIYRDNCLRCHGAAGTGRGPAHRDYLPLPRNLTNTPYFRSLENERIVRSIAHGVPGTGMPAFGEKLSHDEIWGLVEKIRHFSRTQAREDQSP